MIVSGKPGVSYGTPQPWLREGAPAGACWRVCNLDEETGHFEAFLVKAPAAVPV